MPSVTSLSGPVPVAFVPAWSPPLVTAGGVAACRLSEFQDAWAELDQAVTIGRTTAELERAASTVVALSDQLGEAESVRRRTTHRLSIALAVAATQAIAAGLASAWVR